MKCRDEFPDWFTENQWLKKGYIVKRGHLGEWLWTNRHYSRQEKYFSSKDVRKDEEKASSALKEINKKARFRAKKLKEKFELEHRLRDEWNTSYQWNLLGREPNKDAQWKTGDQLNGRLHLFGSNYCYCHESDTHELKKE